MPTDLVKMPSKGVATLSGAAPSNEGDVQARLAQRLRRVESRNLTFVAPGWPIFWKRAAGSEVWDATGKRYIDFSSAFGVASVGHAHPDVVAAASRQIADLTDGMGDVHPPEVKLIFLERLATLFPWPVRSILGLNGSDAVEAALKTAMLATGRPGVVALEGAYHGLGYGAMQVTWRSEFRAPFAAQCGGFARFIPFPSGDGDASLEALDRELARGDVGAVILEPIQGRGGVRIPPSGWMAALSTRAHAAGALVIADEIMTGLGRTGSIWSSLAADGSPSANGDPTADAGPDLLVCGKALGGGLPLSACVGRIDVMDAWPESTGEAIHTSTFLGHPPACRAALTVLDVLERDHLAARSAALGDSVRLRLGAWGARGRGLMIGIPCASASAAHAVVRRALDHGLILLADGVDGDTLVLLPALNIPRPHLDEGLAILEEALAAVC